MNVLSQGNYFFICDSDKYTCVTFNDVWVWEAENMSKTEKIKYFVDFVSQAKSRQTLRNLWSCRNRKWMKIFNFYQNCNGLTTNLSSFVLIKWKVWKSTPLNKIIVFPKKKWKKKSVEIGWDINTNIHAHTRKFKKLYLNCFHSHKNQNQYVCVSEIENDKQQSC